MKKMIIIEIVLFVVTTLMVIKFNCYKTALVYLLFCEALSTINRHMERYLAKLKKVNDIYEYKIKQMSGDKNV